LIVSLTVGQAMAVADHLNEALDISLAWGPQRAVPVAQRLKEAFPALSDDEIAALERECSAVLSMACRLADEIGDRGLAPAAAHAQFHARFPTLDAKRAGAAMHQGYYSYWRDNGRGPEERRS
jgi:hypothetical protein